MVFVRLKPTFLNSSILFGTCQDIIALKKKVDKSLIVTYNKKRNPLIQRGIKERQGCP